MDEGKRRYERTKAARAKSWEEIVRYCNDSGSGESDDWWEGQEEWRIYIRGVTAQLKRERDK